MSLTIRTLLPRLALLVTACLVTVPTIYARPSRTCRSGKPAETLKCKLRKAVNSHQTFFGHHDDPVYGHEWTNIKDGSQPGRSDVLEVTGSYPGAMSWDLGGMELNDSLNLDGVPFRLIAAEAVAQDARGGINLFSWHPRNPVTGGDSWDTSDKTAVRKIRTEATYKKQYQENLRRMARYFKNLVRKDGTRIPVVFRPWHEQSGSWFWWGQPNCNPADYKYLWREMRAIFDSEGVDNVVWAFSPDRVKDEDQYMLTYPGDSYVDIMGTDVYEFNGEGQQETYDRDADRSLQIVRTLSARHNKIPAFTETGLEGLTNPEWFTGRLLPLLRKYPVAYVTVWRNAEDNKKHFFTPYKGHPGAQDFRAFTQDEMIKMTPVK